MKKGAVSRYGVYRDLSLSPYEYESPYGDLFKFSSRKKLEMYARDIQKELDRVGKFVDRLHLEDFLTGETIHRLYRSTYKAFYRKIEG